MPMSRFFLVTCAVALIAAPAATQRSARREQDAAFAARQSGQVKPLREIEGRVLPRMAGASYIGPEYDSRSGNYRLKFMRGDSVIWIDVDGHTGDIIGRSGD
ncbi:hypothetical protein PQ455_12890 [Sphingomonas naphthae]|uniref:PepSY domain-containing protein n=1 Tax=Sphingomonas naphthae TaxID=1813468 RepID=A0ABY7TH39_9SPHN|nr:hypothetical protein [Sphingomonas naphthae]WCT72528.1 hypothetical protein PQ455_12890 [Sphingomonas naphthae]